MVVLSFLLLSHPYTALASPQTPATPHQWQEIQKGLHVGGLTVAFNGKFLKTSDDLDLSRFTSDQIYFGCPNAPLKITRKTMVIVFPNDTLLRTETYPSETTQDKLVHQYGLLKVKLQSLFEQHSANRVS